MRPKKLSSRYRQLEKLEQRLCLAFDVGLQGGYLTIYGDANGPLDVQVQPVLPLPPNAPPAYAISVADASGDVFGPALFNQVAQGIQIRLSGEGPAAHDDVTLDLSGQNVERVFADLGQGDNRFTLSDGTVGNLTIRAGDGDDSVIIEGDATVSGLLSTSLGGGNNSIYIAGDVGTLIVRSGNGNDTVTVADGAEVDQIFARVGAGSNALAIAGEVGIAHFDSGSGDDTVTVAGEAEHLLAMLGSGDNHIALEGTVTKSAIIQSSGQGDDRDTLDVAGTIGKNLVASLGGGHNDVQIDGIVGGEAILRGGAGNDSISVGSSGRIEGNLAAHMGGGDNSLAHAGFVGNNLLVFSTNPDDSPRVKKEGTVVGQTVIRTERPRPRDIVDRLLGMLFN